MCALSLKRQRRPVASAVLTVLSCCAGGKISSIVGLSASDLVAAGGLVAASLWKMPVVSPILSRLRGSTCR